MYSIVYLYLILEIASIGWRTSQRYTSHTFTATLAGLTHVHTYPRLISQFYSRVGKYLAPKT